MDAFEKEIARAISSTEEECAPKQRPGGIPFPGRVLLVAPSENAIEHLLRDLQSYDHVCAHVECIDHALTLIESEHFELALVSAEIDDGCEVLLARLGEHLPAAKVVMISTQPTAEQVIRAMRLGAVDFFHIPIDADVLQDRIIAALDKVRYEQRRDDRMERLKIICQELNTARKQIADQLDLICREMVTSHEGLTGQLNDVAMASEFRTLVRQELDVEDMLRTSLEYLLAKTGPTNAAVFLADEEGQYSLGAYVNYDCPRETIAEVLEHLGTAICPQMEEEPEIVSFADASEFAQWLEIDTGFLAQSQVIAFSCVHDGECQAVIVLFRTATKPFPDSLVGVIDTLRPIFAAQLVNVAHVHERALPSWPEEAIGEEDEYDGYGFGGLAA